MHPLKQIFQNLTGYWIHKVETLPVGANLLIDIENRIGCKSIKTIFDVGANEGQTLTEFRRFFPNATIHCFEPVAGTFKRLQDFAKQYDNYVLENIAFAEEPGKKTIRLFDDYSSLNSLKDNLMNTKSNAIEEVITMDTVDNYCLAKNIKKIDLLKIDTEGYEINVLEGAKKMLSEGRVGMLYCEVGLQKNNTRNTNLAVITDWLAGHDYYFFGLYQLVSDGWQQEAYFGNALFVNKSLYANY